MGKDFDSLREGSLLWVGDICVAVVGKLFPI